MSTRTWTIVWIAFFTFLALATCSGCNCLGGIRNMSDEWCERQQPKSASWDQENLKRFDSGCPNAIYIAPGGNLVECEP